MQDLHETTFNQWRNLRFEPRGGAKPSWKGSTDHRRRRTKQNSEKATKW